MPHTIHLRHFEESDAADFTRLINNPAVYRYLSAKLPIPYTEDLARDFVARCRRGARIERAIEVDGKLAGGIGCALPETAAQPYSISYWLGEPYWRQGIMTRALRLLLDEMREGLVPLGSVVEAKVFAAHTVSERILLHAGFLRQSGFELIPMRDGLLHTTRTYHLTI